MTTPERQPLDVCRLRARRLVPDGRFTAIDVVESTGSTNDDLVSWASGGGGDAVLIAEQQSAGRGRRDRQWSSPYRSCLAMSVLVTPTAPPADWTFLPLLVGVAVAESVTELGAVTQVKWPNDLLGVDGRKMGGILVTKTGDRAVIGIGVNVDVKADEFGDLAGASSISWYTGRSVDRTALAGAILDRLEIWMDRWSAASPRPGAMLAAAYRSRSATLGRRVRVEPVAASPFVGTAVDIDAAGALVVDARGHRLSVSAADVVHVRPADGGQ
jgi:BirA family transcriptional regulator, biotin operon repressor / biotin---[acetyl-CoA-carboxylase] ligase